MTTIDSFTGEYAFLSNFYPSPVEIGLTTKIPCATVEHAYQASKTPNVEYRQFIAGQPTPGKAKYEGRRCKMYSDWDHRRVGVMHELLRQKFQGVLAEKLLATGDALLIEGNDWGDKFWGQVDGTGTNLLGKLLMLVRDEIRTAQAS